MDRTACLVSTDRVNASDSGVCDEDETVCRMRARRARGFGNSVNVGSSRLLDQRHDGYLRGEYHRHRYDDTLILGNGNDYAIGGYGDDTVLGEAGDDEMYGHEGDDVLRCQARRRVTAAAIAEQSEILFSTTSYGGSGKLAYRF